MFFPDPGLEPSTITDFDGLIAVLACDGTGKGTDTKTGATKNLLFEADMRLMLGTYVGVNGQRLTGTFGFI